MVLFLGRVTLALTGDDYEINLTIEYVSKEHQHLEEAHEEKKLLDDL